MPSLVVVTFTVTIITAVNGFTLSSSSSSDVISDICVNKPDGYHKDSSCINYWLCKNSKAVFQRSCTDGTLFNGLMCVPSDLVPNCKSAEVTNECVGLKNGLHRNFYSSDCSDYVMCENGLPIIKGKCKNNTIFDGNSCTKSNDSSNKLLCHTDNNNTEDDLDCSNKLNNAGVYPVGNNCRSYFYCNNNIQFKSQLYECANGYIFDVNLQKCVTGDNCSANNFSQDNESDYNFCSDKQDGYYQDTSASGCRSYVFCHKGKKIIYLCPEGYAFDGSSCKVDTSFTCPYWSRDCSGKPNGYHADTNTACRQYFYCLNENKVMTLTCSKNRVFDGSKCIPRNPNFSCERIFSSSKTKYCNGKDSGKYLIPGSKCQNFITCHANKVASYGSCAQGFFFINGECVKNDNFQCLENICDKDGLYKNPKSKTCKDYIYCMNGKMTDLTCPNNTVFNGYLCVDDTSYSCTN